MDTQHNIPAWASEATGEVDLKKLINSAGGVYELTMQMVHQLHFLVADLESGLDIDRGNVRGNNVTLSFQKSGIEATLWLVGTVWSRASDLAELLENAQRLLEDREGEAGK